MKLKVEYGIIAVLVLALLYYVSSHHRLLIDLSFVPHDNNPQLKAVKAKHHNTKDCDGYWGPFALFCNLGPDPWDRV